MKRIIVTLITTISLSVALLHNGTVATAKDKLSSYDKTVQETMNECYLNLDDDLKDYIKVNNYHIVFLKEDKRINDMEEYKNLEVDSAALIDYQRKYIYVQYNKDVETMEINLNHELGHLLDSKYNFISETDNFNKVWNLRYDFYSHFSIDTTYYEENKRECFAQMYAIYKQYPEWVNEVFPSIYEYFNELQ